VNADLSLSLPPVSDSAAKKLIKEKSAAVLSEMQTKKKRFYDAMISGKALNAEEFGAEILGDPINSLIASSLFFSIYDGKILTGIVTVDNGGIYDLENKPYEISSGKSVRVLHPVEIAQRYKFLKQLKITQVFGQVHRPGFLAEEYELAANSSKRVAGCVVRAKDLKKNLSLSGFKPMNKDIDGISNQAYLERGGIVCAAEFSSVNFARPQGSVTMGELKFYEYKDLIRLSRQIYTEGAPLKAVKNIGEREYSEFLYSAFILAGRL
jgi:hypothetical protein